MPPPSITTEEENNGSTPGKANLRQSRIKSLKIDETLHAIFLFSSFCQHFPLRSCQTAGAQAKEGVSIAKGG